MTAVYKKLKSSACTSFLFFSAATWLRRGFILRSGLKEVFKGSQHLSSCLVIHKALFNFLHILMSLDGAICEGKLVGKMEISRKGKSSS